MADDRPPADRQLDIEPRYHDQVFELFERSIPQGRKGPASAWRWSSASSRSTAGGSGSSRGERDGARRSVSRCRGPPADKRLRSPSDLAEPGKRFAMRHARLGCAGAAGRVEDLKAKNEESVIIAALDRLERDQGVRRPGRPQRQCGLTRSIGGLVDQHRAYSLLIRFGVHTVNCHQQRATS